MLIKLVYSQKSRKTITKSKRSEKSNSTSAKPATIIWELNAAMLGKSVAYNFVPKHCHDPCENPRSWKTHKRWKPDFTFSSPFLMSIIFNKTSMTEGSYKILRLISINRFLYLCKNQVLHVVNTCKNQRVI
jgi:hypothetical protein